VEDRECAAAHMGKEFCDELTDRVQKLCGR
jgi:hypothetical protein